MRNLNDKLLNVEQIAGLSKVKRFLHHPFKYVLAVGYRKLIYPIIKKGLHVKTISFFNEPISVSLPAGTDIYLTGGKSDSSEIRLAKFIINNLAENECFIDVGAHYGYFTLLAGKIAGKGGRVISFEPSIQNYQLLLRNTSAYSQISIFNCAVSDSNEELLFYEFPSLYSEFSTAEIKPFEQQKWFAKYRPVEKRVAAITLDEIIKLERLSPKIVKIDVEGGEYKVIKGFSEYLSANNCLVVMEYLDKQRHNEAHQKARELLFEFGFSASIITGAGLLEPVDDIDSYLSANRIESENIVFHKTGLKTG